MPSKVIEQIEEIWQLVYEKGEYKKAQKALEVVVGSKEITTEESIKCSIIKCQILTKQGEFSKSIELADKTTKKVLEINNDILLLELFTEKMEALWRKGDYQTQMEIAAKAEMIVEKIHQKDDALIQEKIGNFYMWKAAYIWIQPDLNRAISLLLKALQCFDKAQSKIHFANVNFLLGTLHSEKGDRDIGYQLQEQSLKDFEEIGHTRQIALALTNLAGYSLHEGNYQKALQLVERSLKLRKQIGNKQDIALTLGHIVNIRIACGEYDQALKIQKQSLELFEEIESQKNIPPTLGQIGNIYYYLGERDLAFENLKRALKLATELKDYLVMAHLIDDLITKNLELNDVKQAKILFDQLQEINSLVNAPLIDGLFHLTKAQILMTQDDARNRGKAEGILEYLLSSSTLGFVRRTKAIVSLCELLLVELLNTGKEEIFEELSDRIDYLIDISEVNQAIVLLIEGYRLKSLLYLIMIDIPKSIKTLEKALTLAKDRKLEQFTIDIQNDIKQITERESFWNQMKKEQKSLVDILKQTPLMNGMKRLAKETILAIEERQPIDSFEQRKLFSLKI